MLETIIPTLNADEAKILETYCKCGEAERGAVLIEEGSNTQDLYFLITGKFKVFQLAILAQQNCALEIAELKADTLLGEANLFRKCKRAASVLVTEESKYLVLPQENFLKLKTGQANIAVKVLEFCGSVVAERLVSQQLHIHTKLIAEANDIKHAYLNLQRYVGGVQICSPEIAAKLFNIKQPKI